MNFLHFKYIYNFISLSFNTKGDKQMNNQKSESKKLIPLYLQQLFLEKTDKTHYIRMPEILSFLETKGIYADRRTIYSAISLLNTINFEIIGVQEKGGYKYHHPKRLFTKNEIKFLIDSIATSKFLTEKKSKELINKVKTLGSIFDNDSINRTVLLNKRIKSMNDKVFKNLDTIYSAISTDKQITFQYLHWNPQKKLVSKAGKIYLVSPYAVSLTDDNYYLISFDSNSNELRHYRIDKMQSVKIIENTRIGKSLFQSFDIADYSRKTFGMFGGREETITLEVSNHLAGVFIDRFGNFANIRPNFNNPNTFIVRIAVNVSPQFYAWLFGLGTGVKIISPDPIISDYKNMIESVLKKYTHELSSLV